MKKLLALAYGLVFAMEAWAGAVTATKVVARQRYPWNGFVDIVVTLQGSESDLGSWDCVFAATNVETQAAIPVSHIDSVGELTGSGTARVRRFRWDAMADVGKVKIDKVALYVATIVGGVQLWEDGPYWSECNVGATKPEEFGYYFWWGDTVGYTHDGSKWNAVDGSCTVFTFSPENCPTYEKTSAQLQAAGYLNSRNRLIAAHDAATVHLGAPWRMPTYAEFGTLINECDTTWTMRNGVRGRLIRGRGTFSSKSIFIPAAGGGPRDDRVPTQTIISGNEFVNIPGWAIRCSEQSSLYVQVNVFKNIGGAIFADEITDVINATGNHFETTVGRGNGETIMKVESTISAALVVWGDNKLAEGENAALRVPITSQASSRDWAEVTQGSKFLGFYPVKSSNGARYVEVESAGSGSFDYVLDTDVSIDNEKRFTSGSFTRDPSALVSSGYKAIPEDSGWRVTAYLAKIVEGDGKFVSACDSLEEALAAAADGQRVVQQVSGDIAIELPDYDIGKDVAIVLAPGVVNSALTAGVSSVIEKRKGADGSLICQAVAVTDSVTLQALADSEGRSKSLTFTADWMLDNGISPRQLADTTYIAENGLAIWESYVMGLDPNDASSCLKLKVTFGENKDVFVIEGGAAEEVGLVDVKYVLYATDSLDKPFEKISEAQDATEFELEKSSFPSRFYKVGVDIRWL